jgi:hypothetical protein
MTPRKRTPIARLLKVVGKFEGFPQREQPLRTDKRDGT